MAEPAAEAPLAERAQPPPTDNVELASVPSPTALIVGPPQHTKLAGWDLYRSIGSPKYIVAPMVDQSELAWRVLSRLHGAQLVYSPMIHAGLFAADEHPTYLRAQFDLASGEEGADGLDRPLFVQFCANDPATFLRAAMKIAAHGRCDAIDLNLGCPQGIAKRGKYGAFLFEDWDLIERMIHHMHINLPIPITAKFRVTDDVESTVAYAQMLERAGAQILCCHGRTREQKGHNTGLADWEKIAAVKRAVNVPVFSNGNVLTHGDVDRSLAATGCEGVMSADGNLANPALFGPLVNRDALQSTVEALPAAMRAMLDGLGTTVDDLEAPNPPIVDVCRRYLGIIRTLKTQTATSAVKAHLFRLLKPLFQLADGFTDLRERLSGAGGAGLPDWAARIADFAAVVEEVAARLDVVEHRESADRPADASPHYTRVQALVRPALAEPSKRAHSPDAADAPAEKRPKPAVSSCARCGRNAAASGCTALACSACCDAGADCPTHAAKARKREEKLAAKRSRRADRKARAGGAAVAEA